jgi:hypothetical protein
MSLQNIDLVVCSSTPPMGFSPPRRASSTAWRVRSCRSSGSASIADPPSGGTMHETYTRCAMRSGTRRATSEMVRPPIE